MVLFYNKTKFKSYIYLIEKKIISFSFSNKFYLRGKSFNNKQILDNESQISEKNFELKVNLTGNSTAFSTNFYKHNFNEKLKFKNTNLKFIFNKKFIFKLLDILTKTKNSLIVTTIKRGGMYAFNNGLKGFLPQSHFYKVLNKILCVSQYTLKTISSFFSKKTVFLEQNKNIVFLPNFKLKLKFFLPKKNKNFNNKRKKKYKKKKKFNFIFLFYKNINYEYQNKKNIEKFRLINNSTSFKKE